MKSKKYIVAIVAALLLALFLYTAIQKLREHSSFEYVLMRSPLIGKYSVFISWMIPVLEIVLVVLLFIPGSRRIGLLFSLITLVAFTGYLIYMILYTKDYPCNCGGVISSMSWPQHIVFNLFFIFLNTIALVLTRAGQERPSSPP